MKILRVLPLVLCLLGISSFAFAQTPLTAEIEVNPGGPGGGLSALDSSQSVSMNARGEFVVVWSGRWPESSSGRALLARGFAADGTPRSGPVVVSEESYSTFYASAGEIREDGSFLVVYQIIDPDGLARLKGRLFAPDGAPLGEAFPVADSRAGFIAVASREDGGFVVAWMDEGIRVFYRLLAPGGESVGPERRLGNGFRIAVAAGPGNEMVVAWDDWSPDTFLQAVAVQRLRPDGSRRGGKFLVNHRRRSRGIRPEVGIDGDGNILVLWSDREVRARRYGRNGAAQGKVRRIAASGTISGFAMDRQGGFTLVWPSLREGADYVVRRFQRDGSPLGPIISAGSSGAYWFPVVAGDEAGNFVVVFSPDSTRLLARIFSAE